MHYLRHRHRGQALVEFALIVPIMITIALGVLDMGRLFYYDVEFQSSLREAARYAADAVAAKPPPSQATLNANATTIIQSEGNLIAANLVPGSVAVTQSTGSHGTQIMSVSATYRFYFISPWFQQPPFAIANPLALRNAVASELGTGGI